MRTAEFPFGEWLPERIDYKNPGLEVCKNAIPGPVGYRPARGVVSTGASVTGTVIGAKGFQRSDAEPVVVCATTSDLYVIVSGAATASSLGLSLSASDFVTFEQFESQIWASTRGGDTWYLADIETDNTFSAAPGTPPEANALGTVDNFLVMGNLTDIDASSAPYRIRWSRIGDPAGTWGTDIAFQSGAQDLDAQQGSVTAISGGSFGIVFQRNGISRLTYTGGGSVFDLEIYERNRGCVAPRSVVRVGDIAYFLSTDGFFKTDGSSVQSISRSKIWDWFVDNSNQTYLENVVGAIHWELRCVVWLFSNGDDETFTGQLWWNWETERWSYVDAALDYVVETGKSGTTLEQLSVTYPNLDTMPISLDSPEFRASGLTLGAFSGGDFVTVTGSELAAEFVTGSIQPVTGQRTYIDGVTPLIENETENSNVTLYCRETMTQSLAASDTVTIGAIGYAPFSHDARYFRVGVNIPAASSWSDAYGVQIDYRPSGRT